MTAGREEFGITKRTQSPSFCHLDLSMWDFTEQGLQNGRPVSLAEDAPKFRDNLQRGPSVSGSS